MRVSVVKDGRLWDVLVSRPKDDLPLVPVWLVWFDHNTRKTHRVLLAQLAKSERFGWTIVVHGDVIGVRLVEGFKQRWQAIQYAINIRKDLNTKYKESNAIRLSGVEDL